jgi:predicted transcriptional regulator
MTTKHADTAVLSVRTSKKIHTTLQQLAKKTKRSQSALIGDALEQYVTHQEWIEKEIRRGVTAADEGNVVSDQNVRQWVQSLA